MRFVISILVFIFTNTVMVGQETHDIEEGMSVVALGGLNIRSSPTTNSKVLKSIPFGTVVYPLDDVIYKKDTINKVIGSWIKVKFDKTEGYAFSPYLVSYLTIERVSQDSEMIILMEGMPGYFTSFEPDFHYCCLYQQNITLAWEKIDVNFLVAQVDGFDKFEGEHCLEDFPNIKIKSNSKNNSILIIGSRKLLDENKITTLFVGLDTGFSRNSDFLYPEKIFSIEYNETSYNLRAFDSISVDFNNRIIEKHYQIQFYTGYDLHYDYSKFQNISRDLDLYSSGQRHSFFQTPIIQWAGDINGDGILDVIFYQNGLVEHGGTFWQHGLFLGKKVGDKIILKKESYYIIGSCV